MIIMDDNGELDAKFPIGLKVLAVDANIVCLKYLLLLLHKCRYKVTATTEAAEAIRLLKDEKEGFDIVITDVVGVDMDGFNLLRTILRHRIDIPVVMVSANDELDMVKRGVMEGAEAYLLKPLGLSEVRNIWQHVLRKRRSMISRKSNFNDININKKKPRVHWTKERHAKFIQAYEQLEEKERVPNNILKLMNEPQLSREHVASHLQKYRDGLRKIKKKAGRNYKASNFIKSAKLRSAGEFECFNFASNHNYNNSMISRPCDNNQNYLGFGSNNINLPCPGQYPLPLGGDCLNKYYYSTNSQTFGNCPIDDVQAAAPIPAWPFPDNTTTGQCSDEVQQFDHKGISCYGGLMDNDGLSDILRSHLENFLN